MSITILVHFSFVPIVQCFWPPAYNIKLHQNETFIVSELVQDEDDAYQDNDEMIQKHDLSKFQFNKDSDKYFKLHKFVSKVNQEWEITPSAAPKIVKLREINFDLEDSQPWQIGFVHKDGKFEESVSENVFYLSKIVKKGKRDQKRQDLNQPLLELLTGNVNIGDNVDDDLEANYDYNSLKKKYEAEVSKAKDSNDTLRYKEVVEKETLQDSLNVILRPPKVPNCTAAEDKGIGSEALICILKKPSKVKTKKFAARIFKICLLWLGVYLIIAIPLWCHKGWCCCCFRCMFCRPRERLEQIKEFFAQNPAGVYHDKDGKIIEYEPTSYELYYLGRLEKSLRTLR